MVTGLQVSTLALLTGPHIQALIIPVEKGKERLRKLMACNCSSSIECRFKQSASRIPALTIAFPGLQQQQQNPRACRSYICMSSPPGSSPPRTLQALLAAFWAQSPPPKDREEQGSPASTW